MLLCIVQSLRSMENHVNPVERKKNYKRVELGICAVMLQFNIFGNYKISTTSQSLKIQNVFV